VNNINNYYFSNKNNNKEEYEFNIKDKNNNYYNSKIYIFIQIKSK
jgi:hypothetical protein